MANEIVNGSTAANRIRSMPKSKEPPVQASFEGDVRLVAFILALMHENN